MNLIVSHITIGALLALAVATVGAVPHADAQIVLSSSAVGAGGAPSSDGTIVLNGTLGQSAIAPVSGFSTVAWQGFWYTLPGLQPSDVREEPVTGQTGNSVVLMQNVPNPFSESTELRVQLPRSGYVSLKLYDRLGRQALTLIDGVRESGTIALQISATDLESGQYTAQLITDGVRRTITMIVVK